MENKSSSLKAQLAMVTPLVEDLKLKKEERIKQFAEIKGQIEKINSEISGYTQFTDAINSLTLEEQDLSLRKLGEYQSHLRTLQKEKVEQFIENKFIKRYKLQSYINQNQIQLQSERLHKVLAHVNEVHSTCRVLGLDFGKTISDVHPSLHGTSPEQATNISDTTLEGLENAILKLKTEKKVRFQKVY